MTRVHIFIGHFPFLFCGLSLGHFSTGLFISSCTFCQLFYSDPLLCLLQASFRDCWLLTSLMFLCHTEAFNFCVEKLCQILLFSFLRSLPPPNNLHPNSTQAASASLAFTAAIPMTSLEPASSFGTLPSAFSVWSLAPLCSRNHSGFYVQEGLSLFPVFLFCLLFTDNVFCQRRT